MHSPSPGAGDPDWNAAHDPGSSPQQLADIASRRWDLHAAVAAHPHAYPELRGWIAQVNPPAMQPNPPAVQPSPAITQPAQPTVHSAEPHPYGPQTPPYAVPSAWTGSPAPVPPQRRRGLGWWFAGCGCLALVAVLVIGIALLGGLGAALTPEGSSGRPSAPAAPGGQGDPLAEFEAERKLYHELVASIEGNPVAALVSRPTEFQRLEERAKTAGQNEFAAQTLAQQARQIRTDLEQSIAAAEKRRVNSSGTVTEGLVDADADGFVDIRWDAASACAASEEEGWRTAACVTKEDSLTVHLLPEEEYDSEWEMRMLAVHELTHVYQRADDARFDDRHGQADRLVEQGLFEGSLEKMADCYALTYHDQWTLSQGNVEIGYGYVCGDAERQAIREWAADLGAPMPG